MKLYIIITAVVCCLMLIFPLVLTGIYGDNTEEKNTVTTGVTVSESSVLF